MSLHVLRIAMAAAIAVSGFATAAGLGAEPVPESQAQRVQSVIAAQLQAFADDDADLAFEATTPQVREAIGSASYFLALVRGSYPMVYRPASVTFMRPELLQGQAFQLAEIVDADGKSWLALFSLEQQADASWRISGCSVAEN